MHREALSGIYGYEDGIVKGFDLESEINDGYDNTIEKLEIYQEFLGENEFIKIKDNFYKALYVMTELHNVEKERIYLNAPI
jgi:hypothetical protein